MVRMTIVLTILVSGLTGRDFALRPFSENIYFEESWSIDMILEVEPGYEFDYYEDDYMVDLYEMINMDMGIDVISLAGLSCRPGFGGAFDIIKRYETMGMRIRGEMFGVSFQDLVGTSVYEETIDSVIRATLHDSVVVYSFSPDGQFLGGTFGGQELATDPGDPWNSQDPFGSGLFLPLQPQNMEPGSTWRVTRDTAMSVADFGKLEMRSDGEYRVVGREEYQGREVLRVNYENTFTSKPNKSRSMVLEIEDFSGSDSGYILYDVETGLPVKVETRFFFTGLFTDDTSNRYELEVTALRQGSEVGE